MRGVAFCLCWSSKFLFDCMVCMLWLGVVNGNVFEVEFMLTMGWLKFPHLFK